MSEVHDVVHEEHHEEPAEPTVEQAVEHTVDPAVEATHGAIATAAAAVSVADTAIVQAEQVAAERIAQADARVLETIEGIDAWRTQMTETISTLAQSLEQHRMETQERLSSILQQSESSSPVNPEAIAEEPPPEGEEAPIRRKRHRFL
jgi:hypothetical protein